MSDAPRGLSMLPLPDLERLRRLLGDQQLEGAVSEVALRAAGFGRFADQLAGLFAGMSSQATALAVDVAIAERLHRASPQLRLVWTGPEGHNATARDTSMLVTQLFADARREVLIAGFRFDHGVDIFAPLHRVMVEQGVKTTVFIDVDIKDEEKAVQGADDYARRAVERFMRWNWPFGEPNPAVYYDPRTALPGPPWVSLHAKCVVVDERFTFVTSANFTDRGQTRNIELGVLIDDTDFARRVTAQWWGLIADRKVVMAKDG